MKKKIVTSVLSLAAIMGGLVSCGTKESTSEETAKTTASGSKITIDFWHTSGAGITSGYEEAAEAFAKLVKKNEGVDIQINASYQGGYADVERKITNGLAVGNTPTIAIAYPDAVADYISLEKKAGDYVVNLQNYADDPQIGFGKEPWIGDGDASDFVADFLEEGRHYVNEGMYSLPVMKSTEVMFYNQELTLPFAKAYGATKGMNIISTAQLDEWLNDISWEDFMDFCRYIAANKGNQKITYPAMYDSASNLFISQSYQQNIPYISITNGKGSADYDNAAAKAMVQGYKDAYDAHALTIRGVKDQTYASSHFQDQEVLFCIGSSGGAGYQDPQGQFKYGICKVPYSNNTKKYISQGPTVCLLNNTGVSDEVNAQKVKYAWKFLKYLTSTDVNTTLTLDDSQGYLPVRQSCYKTQYFQDFLAEDELLSKTARVVIHDINGNYISSPSVKGSSVARDDVGGIITSYLAGTYSTIDEAFRQAIQHTTLNM